MSFRIINEVLASCLMVGIATVAGNAIIQEQDDEAIEIVDQDGRQVKARMLNWQDSDGNEGADIQVADGKIVIIDENGERREIDVTGARNIIVNKSVKSVMQDGEEQKKVSGRAIIVGPDGKKQVIELGDGLGGTLEMQVVGDALGGLHTRPFFKGQDGRQGLPATFFFAPHTAGKYMIGLSCHPVSDELRTHLDLAEGNGLVVSTEPAEDSPAAEAGVEIHDILLRADESELSNEQNLIDAVQLAGNEDRAVTLTLIRRGKELGIDVKPIERKTRLRGQLMPQAGEAAGDGEFKFEMRVEEFGPGLIFDAEQQMPADILEKMEAIDERIKERMEELTRLQEEFRRSFPKPDGRDKDDEKDK